MDIQYLHTFQTVTKTDSFAQAAEKLGYTRSTVTFRIYQLEREFGLKLFKKIGRQMHLTEKDGISSPLSTTFWIITTKSPPCQIVLRKRFVLRWPRAF